MLESSATGTVDAKHFPPPYCSIYLDQVVAAL